MGKRAQGKRAARDLARHMYDNQIVPQIIADEMRAQGHRIDVTLVSTSPEAEGVEITCVDCGRTARMATPLPDGKAAICPACIRKRRG